MNKKWDSVDISKFTNSGHFDFVTNILAQAKLVPAIAEHCAAELTAMDAAVKEEDEAMLHALKSPYTKDLWEQDGIRDRRYYNVSELTRAYTKWPDETAQKAAADRVMECLNIYKVKPQAQVNKETGAMTNLLQELQGELAADIATLGLTEIVAQMAAANAEVNKIYNDRLWADSVKVTGRVAKARAEVDRCYTALREKVNALVIVFGAEDYSGFIGYVNEFIASAKRWQLSGRKKGSGTGGSEEIEEEVTEEEEEEEETGGGEGSTEGGETGGGGETTTYTATFRFRNDTEVTRTGAAGSPLNAPSPSAGCRWNPEPPAEMPAENTTYTEVSDPSTGGTEL